jgi:hypothetical protein
MIEEIKEFNRLKLLRQQVFTSPDFIGRQNEFEEIKKLLNKQLLILIRLGVNFSDQVFKDEDFYPCPICKINKIQPHKKSWLYEHQDSRSIIKKISDYKKIQDAYKDETLRNIFPKDITTSIYNEITSLGVTQEDINQLDVSIGVFLSPCKDCI